MVAGAVACSAEGANATADDPACIARGSGGARHRARCRVALARVITPSQWSWATRIALRARPASPSCVRRWSREKTARLQIARRTIVPVVPGAARRRTGRKPASATSARPWREVSVWPASMSTRHRCLCLATGKNRAVRRPTVGPEDRQCNHAVRAVRTGCAGRTVTESGMNSSFCLSGRFESTNHSTG